MPHGTIVENLSEQIDPRSLYQGRTSLTGAAQTIDLGAAYRNVEVWADDAATVHWRLNPDGTTTAASTTDPLIPDGGVLTDSLVVPVQHIYFIATAAGGSLNVRAW